MELTISNPFGLTSQFPSGKGRSVYLENVTREAAQKGSAVVCFDAVGVGLPMLETLSRELGRELVVMDFAGPRAALPGYNPLANGSSENIAMRLAKMMTYQQVETPFAYEAFEAHIKARIAVAMTVEPILTMPLLLAAFLSFYSGNPVESSYREASRRIAEAWRAHGDEPLVERSFLFSFIGRLALLVKMASSMLEGPETLRMSELLDNGGFLYVPRTSTNPSFVEDLLCPMIEADLMASGRPERKYKPIVLCLQGDS